MLQPQKPFGARALWAQSPSDTHWNTYTQNLPSCHSSPPRCVSIFNGLTSQRPARLSQLAAFFRARQIYDRLRSVSAQPIYHRTNGRTDGFMDAIRMRQPRLVRLPDNVRNAHAPGEHCDSRHGLWYTFWTRVPSSSVLCTPAVVFGNRSANYGDAGENRLHTAHNAQRVYSYI